jgi:hypothetical protein
MTACELKGKVAIPIVKEKYNINLAETGLCPNCARQGQIFPNISKRNQKLTKKVE